MININDFENDEMINLKNYNNDIYNLILIYKYYETEDLSYMKELFKNNNLSNIAPLFSYNGDYKAITKFLDKESLEDIFKIMNISKEKSFNKNIKYLKNIKLGNSNNGLFYLLSKEGPEELTDLLKKEFIIEFDCKSIGAYKKLFKYISDDDIKTFFKSQFLNIKKIIDDKDLNFTLLNNDSVINIIKYIENNEKEYLSYLYNKKLNIYTSNNLNKDNLNRNDKFLIKKIFELSDLHKNKENFDAFYNIDNVMTLKTFNEYKEEIYNDLLTDNNHSHKMFLFFISNAEIIYNDNKTFYIEYINKLNINLLNKGHFQNIIKNYNQIISESPNKLLACKTLYYLSEKLKLPFSYNQDVMNYAITQVKEDCAYHEYKILSSNIKTNTNQTRKL